jgi:hypothetical protein
MITKNWILSTLESRDHLSNGASPKSLMSSNMKQKLLGLDFSFSIREPNLTVSRL